MVTSNAHPRLVASHVVDTVGYRFALRVARKVVHPHRRRRPLRLPFPALVGEVAHQLLLLRVDRDHRLASRQKSVRGRVDVLELRVAVRVGGAFPPLANRLQPIAQAVQQPAHGSRTDAPSLLGQRRGQLRATLARPAQRRGWVPACKRVHQCFERRHNAGLVLLDAGTASPRGSDAARRRPSARNLAAPLANRLPSQSSGRRDQGVSAIANGHRLGSRPPTTTALVEHRCHRDVLLNNGRFQIQVPLHAASMAGTLKDSNLIAGRLLGSGVWTTISPPGNSPILWYRHLGAGSSTP